MKNLIQISKDDQRWIAEAIQVLSEQDGALVAEVLQGQIGEAEMMFGTSVTATSSQVNKEVQKQNMIFLAQQFAQLYPQLMQYAQGLRDEQLLMGVMQAAYTGTVELQKVLLETYDIQNTDVYLAPQPQQAEGPAAQQNAGVGGQAPGAAPLGGPGGPGALAQGPAQIAQLLGIG